MLNFKPTIKTSSGKSSESVELQNCDVLNLRLTFEVLNLSYVLNMC